MALMDKYPYWQALTTYWSGERCVHDGVVYELGLDRFRRKIQSVCDDPSGPSNPWFKVGDFEPEISTVETLDFLRFKELAVDVSLEVNKLGSGGYEVELIQDGRSVTLTYQQFDRINKKIQDYINRTE